MSADYYNVEMADMHSTHGLASENTAAVHHLYAEKYPKFPISAPLLP